MQDHWLIQILKISWELRLLAAAIIASLVIELKVGVGAKVFRVENWFISCLKTRSFVLTLSIRNRFHAVTSSHGCSALRLEWTTTTTYLFSHILTKWAHSSLTISFERDMTLWSFWSYAFLIWSFIKCRWLRQLATIVYRIWAWHYFINMIIFILN